MTRYFDASALVKRYVRETGSVMVRGLLASGVVATSRLSEVEVASRIVRRAREGAFTPALRDRALAAFQRDVPAFAIVELIPDITGDARALLLRHPLRASDGIQAGELPLPAAAAEPTGPLRGVRSALARRGSRRRSDRRRYGGSSSVNSATTR